MDGIFRSGKKIENNNRSDASKIIDKAEIVCSKNYLV
jgi:hypothetical protein